MMLHILGSGSKGNCYLLKASSGQILIIECGVDVKKIKEGIEFNVNDVVGTLISHEHSDHSKSILNVAGMGIDIYASAGTLSKFGDHHRFNYIISKNQYLIGEFLVVPFDVNHDAKEPLGFLIQHPEMGNLVFVTDSYVLDYKFPDLNNIIIEANYSEELMNMSVATFLKNRIIGSHMSIQTCEAYLACNDLTQVRNIILAHLSDSNSHAVNFQKAIERSTGKHVHIADTGKRINLSLNSF